MFFFDKSVYYSFVFRRVIKLRLALFCYRHFSPVYIFRRCFIDCRRFLRCNAVLRSLRLYLVYIGNYIVLSILLIDSSLYKLRGFNAIALNGGIIERIKLFGCGLKFAGIYAVDNVYCFSALFFGKAIRFDKRSFIYYNLTAFIFIINKGGIYVIRR